MTNQIKPRTERIVDALNARGSAMTRSEIHVAIGGGPVNRLQDDLRRLIAENRIERLAVGGYVLKQAG
jgi:hypothetical protein